jgi:CubicO group peptidase (beta-lactamase class C family)
LALNRDTLFEIASISKTFTATLYALFIRSHSSALGDFIHPKGPLRISASLAGIPLDSLMNYTSGLPQDNDDGTVDTPPFWPQPYSELGMLSYLDAAPPSISPPGELCRYSNLAFAIMASILGAKDGPNQSGFQHFERLVFESIFKPLSMQSMFFDKVSLSKLPLGYNYDYTRKPAKLPYAAATPGWPFFPAYHGTGGIVASPKDMFQWLLFNMGITKNEVLSPLLPSLQKPSTKVKWADNELGLGWFVRPAEPRWSPSIWKDGDLDGFNSYIAFLPSTKPGTVASQAGVFVLANADGITNTQTKDGTEVVCSIANDLLLIMQRQVPLVDKSVYPMADLLSRRRQP